MTMASSLAHNQMQKQKNAQIGRTNRKVGKEWGRWKEKYHVADSAASLDVVHICKHFFELSGNCNSIHKSDRCLVAFVIWFWDSI